MFKLIGAVLVVVSAVLIFSKPILESYFTYKFTDKIVIVLHSVLYEKGTNIPYKKIFRKIDFDKDKYFCSCYLNRYIKNNEINSVKNIFDNLGKRDSNSEVKYIEYNIEKLTRQRDVYYQKYTENQKLYTLCGFSLGLFIVIFLI